MSTIIDPVYLLAKEGKWKDLKEILTIKDMSYRCIEENRNSILIAAVLSGCSKTIHLCLSNLTTDLLDYQNSSGYSCLHYAVLSDNMSIIKMILTRDPDFSLRDNFGETALHKAAARSYDGNVEILVELLNTCSEQVNSLDNFGCTPLYYAAENGSKETVQILLQHGANIDHRTKKGFTALHLMTIRNLAKGIKVLLESGANAQILDSYGKLAIEYADEQGSFIFEEFGFITDEDIASRKMCGVCLNVCDKGHAFSLRSSIPNTNESCRHVFCEECVNLECTLCATELDRLI